MKHAAFAAMCVAGIGMTSIPALVVAQQQDVDIPIREFGRGTLLRGSFSPNSERVFLAGGAQAYLGDADGVALERLMGREKGIGHLVRMLASSEVVIGHSPAASTAKVWDLETGGELHSFGSVDGSTIYRMVASENPLRVLTIYLSNASPRLWDPVTGDQLTVFSDAFPGMAPRPTADIARDSTLVLFWLRDEGVSVINASTGDTQATIATDRQNLISARFMPDNATVVTAHSILDDSDNAQTLITIWNAQNGEEIDSYEYEGAPSHLAVPGTGYLVALATHNYPVSRIRILDTSSGNVLHDFENLTSRVTLLSIAPDSSKILYGSLDLRAHVLELSSESEIASFDGFTDPSQALAILSDGSRIVASGEQHPVTEWSLASGGIIDTITSNAPDRIWAMILSPDESAVLTSKTQLQLVQAPGVAQLWDRETGDLLQTFSGHNALIGSMDFSSDGALLATGSNDNTARIWNVSTGQTIQTINAGNSRVRTVEFSPDDSLLLISGAQGPILLWDIEAEEFVAAMGPQDMASAWSTFSPDGSLILSCHTDRIARIWNVETGEEVRAFQDHPTAVLKGRFLPDGRSVITFSLDGSAFHWATEFGDAVAKYMVPDYPLDLQIHPDGRSFFTSDDGGVITQWRFAHGDSWALTSPSIIPIPE